MSKEAWFNGVRKLWRHVAGETSRLSIDPKKIPTFGKYFPRGDNPEDWVNIHDVLARPREFPGLFAKIMAEDQDSTIILRTWSMIPVDGIEVVAKCLLKNVSTVKFYCVSQSLVTAYTGGSDEKAYWPRQADTKEERNILAKYGRQF